MAAVPTCGEMILEGQSFLRVKVQGANSNLDAIGTEITATVNGLDMVRRVRTASSYLSSSEKTVTFGLGENSQVDTLRIEWPNSPPTVFTNIEKNQEIFVIEGTDTYEQISHKPRRFITSMLLKFSTRHVLSCVLLLCVFLMGCGAQEKPQVPRLK